jgi:AraC-like DNA-binding protein
MEATCAMQPLHVEQQPQCAARDFDVDTLPRAIFARAKDYPAGFKLEPHRHRRGQLAYSAKGTITVTTPQGTWVTPPSRAAWIPAGMEHYVRSSEDVCMRSVFVDETMPVTLKTSCVVSVTPLLRELILYAVGVTPLYELGGPDERLMFVMLDQLKPLPVSSLSLPMPKDRRVAKIAHALIDNPADQRSLTEWAKEVGAAPRTLCRLFPQETGMQFRAWQQQVRLIEALRLLAAGEPVTNVAYDVGYDSPSAFVSMFKRALGKTPGHYFEN